MKSHTEFLSNEKYRPDVDGLRAIAILAVVLYHYFPNFIPGGYVGVDIFFVISGYLITRIIYNEIENSSFSIIDFYVRRVKRIFPALILVLFAVILFGNFILLKDEFRILKDNVFYSSIFLSNYGNYKDSGYFDSASDTKLLLHLWSLAIEMQFYLLWPIILIMLAKAKNYKLSIICCTLFLSFTVCVYQTYTTPTLAFYSPLSRGWEFIVGGLVYLSNNNKVLQSSQRLNSIKSSIGLLIILISCLCLNKYSFFPGWVAVLPSLGAYLIISSHRNSFIHKYILTNKLFLFLGLISYPLYLWHWPLLIFTRTYLSEMPSIPIRAILILIAIFISYLTYRYIEKPITKKVSNPNLPSILIVLMMFIGLYSSQNYTESKTAIVTTREDFEDYFFKDRNQRSLSDFEKKYRHECNFYQVEKYYEGNTTLIPKDKIDDACVSIDASKKTVLIWGDSHAQMLSSGLEAYLPSNWQIVQIASSGCYPTVNYTRDSDSNYCVRSNWVATNFIKDNKIDVVIIAQSSGHNLSIINYTVKWLLGFGVKKVVVMGPAPKWNDFLPRIILRQLWNDIPLRTFIGIDKGVLSKNTELRRAFINSPQKTYVDVVSVFCNSQGCLTSVNEDIKEGIVSWDTGHLTEVASKYLADKILAQVIIED